MAVKFSQFTNTTDPTAIEKVVGYTTAGSVNFQISTANLDTTYLITSPVNGGVAGQIDLTITGTKAGVSSNDVVAITSTGNITLTATAAGYNIDGGGGGVTTFSSSFGNYISGTTQVDAIGNVSIGSVNLSAVNGTSDLTTRFLSQDNTWDLIDRTTGTGTVNKVPLWTTTTNLGDSVIAQSGANIGIGTTSPNVSLTINATDAVQFPAGTTAQRNAISAVNGMLRYSTTDNSFEGYINGAWGAIGGGITKTVDSFSISGTSTNSITVTSTDNPVDKNYIDVYINGVYQAKANFAALSVKTLTLAAGNFPDGSTIEAVTTT